MTANLDVKKKYTKYNLEIDANFMLSQYIIS